MSLKGDAISVFLAKKQIIECDSDEVSNLTS